MRAFTPMILALLLYYSPPALADEPASQPASAPAASAKPPEQQPPLPAPVAAPQKAAAAPFSAASLVLKLWESTHLSTRWYLGYAYGEKKAKTMNAFSVGRGYVTLKFKPVKWFQPRITMDAHQDDGGDWKVRLKYLHAKFVLPLETAIVTEPSVELGIVHGPWFDYEEHIDNYRMEGTMFMERNKLLNSADVGGTIAVLLGRKLPKEYQKEVSKKYPGTWGSVQLGLYNGGGYHAAETNNDKVFASRVSLRPAGPWLPNLQISHFFLYGKGNTIYTPAWMINTVMASFEHKYFTLTAQVGLGEGNQKGDKVDKANPGASMDWFGTSFFGEAKLPMIKSSIIARVDRFDWDTAGGDPATTRLIAGYAFHVLPQNFALLSLDRVTYDGGVMPADWQVKLTLQVSYPPK